MQPTTPTMTKKANKKTTTPNEYITEPSKLI